MAAKVNNPRKQFQFNIIIPGLNPFLCQDVKSPDVDFDVAEHGDTNFMVKTAGMKKIGTITLAKISPAEFIDNYFDNWGLLIQNTRTGGGALPQEYKRTIIIEQYANNGITVIKRWICSGCWPSKFNGIDFSRRSSDNTLENIELQVDEVLPV